MTHMEKAFPITMMAMMIGASITYAIVGDWRKCIYWLAGATITATVTF